jgi:hypothetical protein
MGLKKSLFLSLGLALALSLPCNLSAKPPPSDYLPVFPGAQGFGTDTPAGRGGKIIKVTNLNDSGSGSFRAAAQATGPRIVVFEVSGTINLASDVSINNPYITIAGQTAPSPGITLKGASLRVRGNAHDVLVQHIRIRVGDDPSGPNPDNRDGFSVDSNTNNLYNVVFDHVSVSWAIDENGNSWYPQHNITVSNSIISEGLNLSLTGHQNSYGYLIGDHSKNVSLIGNLFAHNVYRNPAMKGDSSAVVLNNVMYNAGPFFTYFSDSYGAGPSYASIVGNVFIKGPNTSSTAPAVFALSSVDPNTKVYLSDNRYSGTIFGNTSMIVSTPPVWHSSLSPRASDTVEASVLANAGARPADRDAVDNRIVQEVETRTGSVINSQRQVGGWPNLAENHRAFNVPANPNADDNGDGYTNIEELLHLMAQGVEK